MIVAALDVSSADAVALLRGHAVAHDLTGSEARSASWTAGSFLTDGGQQR